MKFLKKQPDGSFHVGVGLTETELNRMKFNQEAIVMKLDDLGFNGLKLFVIFMDDEEEAVNAVADLIVRQNYNPDAVRVAGLSEEWWTILHNRPVVINVPIVTGEDKVVLFSGPTREVLAEHLDRFIGPSTVVIGERPK